MYYSAVLTKDFVDELRHVCHFLGMRAVAHSLNKKHKFHQHEKEEGHEQWSGTAEEEGVEGGREGGYSVAESRSSRRSHATTTTKHQYKTSKRTSNTTAYSSLLLPATRTGMVRNSGEGPVTRVLSRSLDRDPHLCPTTWSEHTIRSSVVVTIKSTEECHTEMIWA